MIKSIVFAMFLIVPATALAAPNESAPADIAPPKTIVKGQATAAEAKQCTAPKSHVICKPSPRGESGSPGPQGLPGLPGTSGETGKPGENGKSVDVQNEPAGPTCPNGGVKLTSATGTVNYVCNGSSATPGQNGKDGTSFHLVMGIGYGVTQVWSKGNASALTYGPEIQLHLEIGNAWEFSAGGTFLSKGQTLTLYGSGDVYPFSGNAKWLGFSLGLRAIEYSLVDNYALGQVIVTEPGVVLRWNPVEHLALRCKLAGLLGFNGFIGGRAGQEFADGYSASCGIGGRI